MINIAELLALVEVINTYYPRSLRSTLFYPRNMRATPNQSRNPETGFARFKIVLGCFVNISSSSGFMCLKQKFEINCFIMKSLIYLCQVFAVVWKFNFF